MGTFKIHLRGAIAVELTRTAEVAGLAPDNYAAQIIEAQLAAQRLERTKEVKSGAYSRRSSAPPTGTHDTRSPRIVATGAHHPSHRDAKPL
jgi:hypothetical protein